MKKEAPKDTTPKPSFAEVFNKYGGKISIEIPDGFAHIEFDSKNGKMSVVWLNDEGYVDEDGQNISMDAITRVADFMRELKELRLDEYRKP